MNQELPSQSATPQPAEAQQATPQETKSGLYKTIAWAVILIGLGGFMLLDPHMMDGATAEGRNALYKSILIMIWGIPGGIGAIGLGGFLGYRAFMISKSGSSKSGTSPTVSKAVPAKRTSSFSDKVAPSKRELEAKAANRKP